MSSTGSRSKTPAWIHPMHGGSFQRSALPNYTAALRENEFAYHGMLLGREIGDRRADVRNWSGVQRRVSGHFRMA